MYPLLSAYPSTTPLTVQPMGEGWMLSLWMAMRVKAWLELSASYCRGDRPLRPAPATTALQANPDPVRSKDGGMALGHHPGKLSTGPEGLRNHATSFPLCSSSPGEPWRALVASRRPRGTMLTGA